MHEHTNDIETALRSIGARQWRTPDYSAFLKEVHTMNRIEAVQRRSLGRVAIAMGALVLTGTSFAAGAYVGSSFQARLVTDDGREFEVQLSPLPDGAFEGVTSQGDGVRFAPQGAQTPADASEQLPAPQLKEIEQR